MASHINAFISFIDTDDGGKEAALLIANKNSIHSEKRLAIIALSKAWAYSSDTYLIKKSKEFAEHLGLGGTWSETRNIADVILNGLDALCMAPEWEMVEKERQGKKTEKGEVKIISDGRVLHEEAIYD